VGTYEIGLDDTVIWCCNDIDAHRGETDTQEKVRRVVTVLRKYSIPFFLEASGSPDSYHIWIPLAETRTYNAFRFIRQINAEAGVNCECWPKQKALGKDSKFGNLVKLPVCVHLKTGNRSVLLDPDTLEPYKGFIQVPGRVHLLEIPELKPNGLQGMPKVSMASGSTLDYCMERALKEQVPLEGSEGHNLRMAIAVKAHAIGKAAEEIASLFEHQADFDYEFSLKKARETEKYDYAPWSCQTLRDKCGDLVAIYCSTCKFGTKAGASQPESEGSMIEPEVLTAELQWLREWGDNFSARPDEDLWDGVRRLLLKFPASYQGDFRLAIVDIANETRLPEQKIRKELEADGWQQEAGGTVYRAHIKSLKKLELDFVAEFAAIPPCPPGFTKAEHWSLSYSLSQLRFRRRAVAIKWMYPIQFFDEMPHERVADWLRAIGYRKKIWTWTGLEVWVKEAE